MGKGLFGLFGTSYALSVTATLDDQHPLEKEIKIINEQFINWLNRHGKQCKTLIIAFNAPHSLVDNIVSLSTELINQPLNHDDVMYDMDIILGIIDPVSQELREFRAGLSNGRMIYKSL